MTKFFRPEVIADPKIKAYREACRMDKKIEWRRCHEDGAFLADPEGGCLTVWPFVGGWRWQVEVNGRTINGESASAKDAKKAAIDSLDRAGRKTDV